MYSFIRAVIASLAFALVIWTISFANPADAQNNSKSASDAPVDAMLIFDASGSMWGKINNQAKISIARRVVGELMQNWDGGIRLGLTAYGHRRKGDCSDIETLVQVGGGSPAQISSLVNRIQPKGKTPLTQAVTKSAQALKYTENRATVILVTDGIETCHPDPCAAAKALSDAGVDFTVHVVGFGIAEKDSQSVRCIATNTGGQYVAANSAKALLNALSSVVEEAKKPGSDIIRIALAKGLEPLKGVNAQFTFFASDAAGKKTGKYLENDIGAVAHVGVDPGTYVVETTLMGLKVPTKLTFTEERQEHVVVLDAALVELNALLSKGTETARDTLEWQIFDASGKRKITGAYGAKRQFLLKAGKYLAKAKVRSVNASLTFQVKAGDQVRKDLDMRSGTVKFKPVLVPGGKVANNNYYNWQVFMLAEDGKSRGRKIDSKGGAVSGEFVLPAGNYILSATDYEGAAVKRESIVNVVSDETIQVEMVLDAALMKYLFTDSSGSRLPGRPVWEIYRKGDENDPSKKITYHYKTKGGLYLPAGELVIKMKLGNKTHSWPLKITAGQDFEMRFSTR